MLQNGKTRTLLSGLPVMIGALLSGIFALAACGQMAQTAAAKQPTKTYVGNFKDNTVSVIDTDAGAVVATVPVSTGPHGMAITHNGRTVYVSRSEEHTSELQSLR